MKKIQFDLSKTGQVYYDGTYISDGKIQLDLKELENTIKVKVPKICSAALEMKVPFTLSSGTFNTSDADVSFLTGTGSPWNNETGTIGNLVKCVDSKLSLEMVNSSLKTVDTRLLGVILKNERNSSHRFLGMSTNYPMYELTEGFGLCYREDSPIFKLYKDDQLLGILSVVRLSNSEGFFANPSEEIWGEYLKYVD